MPPAPEPVRLERLPRFAALAVQMPERRAQVMAVIVGGDDEEIAVLRGSLDAVATVVTDVERGDIVRAFDVNGFPAFAVIDATAVVVSSGYETDQISLPVSS